MPTTIVFPKKFHVTAKGFYRASVIDAGGGIVSSTDWQPNLILDSGLDKIASMPWAQVFQFCVAGNKVGPIAPAVGDTKLEQPYAINSFWLTGSENCGHSVSGNTIKLYRTFDFYRFPTTVLITELGFQESPAANLLFSRVVLPKAQNVGPGQFLRVNYELNITVNPATPQAPSPVPTIGGWTTGASDTEALQYIGLCGINNATSVAQAIDTGGFCNEPFAPGTRSFGPGYGYVNRWQNGADVDYIGGSGSPYTYVGPLFNYTAVYQNPHHFLQYRIQASNSETGGSNRGALTSAAGVFKNYYDKVFFNAMAAYHTYTITFGSSGNNGEVTTVSNSSYTDKVAPSSVDNRGHLWDPIAKYYQSQDLHACNDYFFDPAINDNSKSHVVFPAAVQQPVVQAPFWQDWVVAGSSCFLSTSDTAPAAFGGSQDRASGWTQYELPLRLDEYTPGSFTRTKYAIFDTFIANSAWRSLGIGPTSQETTPSLMNDAASSNGYVYVFNGTNTKTNTHQLRIAFVYTWNRA